MSTLSCWAGSTTIRPACGVGGGGKGGVTPPGGSGVGFGGVLADGDGGTAPGSDTDEVPGPPALPVATVSAVVSGETTGCAPAASVKQVVAKPAPAQAPRLHHGANIEITPLMTRHAIARATGEGNQGLFQGLAPQRRGEGRTET